LERTSGPQGKGQGRHAQGGPLRSIAIRNFPHSPLASWGIESGQAGAQGQRVEDPGGAVRPGDQGPQAGPGALFRKKGRLEARGRPVFPGRGQTIGFFSGLVAGPPQKLAGGGGARGHGSGFFPISCLAAAKAQNPSPLALLGPFPFHLFSGYRRFPSALRVRGRLEDLPGFSPVKFRPKGGLIFSPRFKPNGQGPVLGAKGASE